jgi:diguanylate cyclase (GGDEF)-like protein
VLERTRRTSSAVTVLLVRVCDLALLHDRVGSQVSDEVLGVAAARLRSCLREIDLVARLSADTFGVILETDGTDGNPDRMAAEVAARVVSLFDEPLSTTTSDLALDVRIGVAATDGVPREAAELVRRAELALQGAASSRDGVRFYEAGRHEAAVRRLQVKGALGRAIEREALSLRYQPLVSMRTGATLGVEALLRWDDPDHGELPPAEFIPLAEETALIVPIGQWVLRTALRQRAAWRDELPGLPVVGLSVNVSAGQMARPGLVEAVRAGLDET